MLCPNRWIFLLVVTAVLLAGLGQAEGQLIRRLDNQLVTGLSRIPGRELVEIHILVQAGAAFEAAHPAGVSQLVSALIVAAGTPELSPEKVATRLQELGAKSHGIFHRQGVGLEFIWESPAPSVPQVLEILAQQMQSPQLDTELFARVRAHCAERPLQESGVAARLYEDLSWPARSLAISTITWDQAIAFYHANYLPQRAACWLISGQDVTNDQAFEVMGNAWNSWLGKFEGATQDSTLALRQAPTIARKDSAKPSGRWTLARVSEQTTDLAIATLLKELVQQSVPGVVVSVSPRAVGEEWRFVGLSDTPNTGAKIQSLLATFALLSQAIPPEALSKARKSLLSNLPLQTREQVIEWRHTNSPQAALPLILRWSGVTSEQVQSLAIRLLDPAQMHLLVEGPESLDAQLASFGLPITVLAAQNSATLEKLGGKVLLGKLLLALGGIEQLDALKSLAWSSSDLIVRQGQQFKRTSQAVVQFPLNFRVELKSGNRTTALAVDGSSGWRTTPQGLADMTADEVNNFVAALRIATTPLLKRHRELIAEESLVTWQGQPHRMLTLMIKGGKPVEFILNADFRIVHRSATMSTPAGDVVREEDLENYRQVGGLWLPHRRIIYQDGQLQQRITIQSYHLNPPLPANTFQKPRAKSN